MSIDCDAKLKGELLGHKVLSRDEYFRFDYVIIDNPTYPVYTLYSQ
jgi:hypothetical protein